MAARAFNAAASPAPAAVPASPFPPSKNNTTTGGLANLQWLLRKRRPNKVQHGRPTFFEHHHQDPAADADAGYDDDDECASMFAGATPYVAPGAGSAGPYTPPGSSRSARRGGGEALSRLRSAILAVLARARRGRGVRRGMTGSSVTGTIFGRRRGRVHLALQTDPRAPPALLVELAAYSTGALVREMASGLVRLALECEKDKAPPPPPPPQQQTQLGSHHHQRRLRQAALVEEATWRAYCNGRKCGYAVRRECGADEWRVLRAVEPVSVGAGVLPDGDGAGSGGAGGEGDLMYMRAKFERVVGSRDSEAFYMVNPDGGGGPELSIYLLRV
ncbi:unnamed protein product [Urochloa humidicola]